jgi:putative NADH-flavin reductase
MMKRIGLVAALLLVSACSSIVNVPTPDTPTDYSQVSNKGKTIALLGATGMVGSYVLKEALRQGYSVRVLARSPQKLAALLAAVKDKITIIEGNARDASAIQNLLIGSDVVISALGPVKTDGVAAASISTIASGHIVRAMQAQGIKRYILVSGAAVVMPDDERDFTGWVMRKLVQLSLGKTLRDKQAEYKLLEMSPIQWTLVRCPLIDAEPHRFEAEVTLDTPVGFNLRAGELARFLIEQIESEEYIRKGPFLGSK